MLAKNYRRLATDEVTVDDETMEKAIDFLTSRLKPEELSHLKALLRGERAEAEDDDPGGNERDKLPRPGGSMAADSRGNSFHDRFPDAARIKIGY